MTRLVWKSVAELWQNAEPLPTDSQRAFYLGALLALDQFLNSVPDDEPVESPLLILRLAEMAEQIREAREFLHRP